MSERYLVLGDTQMLGNTYNRHKYKKVLSPMFRVGEIASMEELDVRKVEYPEWGFSPTLAIDLEVLSVVYIRALGDAAHSPVFEAIPCKNEDALAAHISAIALVPIDKLPLLVGDSKTPMEVMAYIKYRLSEGGGA